MIPKSRRNATAQPGLPVKTPLEQRDAALRDFGQELARLERTPKLAERQKPSDWKMSHPGTYIDGIRREGLAIVEEGEHAFVCVQREILRTAKKRKKRIEPIKDGKYVYGYAKHVHAMANGERLYIITRELGPNENIPEGETVFSIVEHMQGMSRHYIVESLGYNETSKSPIATLPKARFPDSPVKISSKR